MRVCLWGTRGSLATPGPATARYGGNTSCVEVRGDGGTILVLDAGTGIRPLGNRIPEDVRRVDVLLTHLHMDHIQGLGFFEPLYRPGLEVHVWGPASATVDLGARLRRYLSPPLFPVLLRDLPCHLHLHEVPTGVVEIGEFRVSSSLVCHPGPTVGYRIESDVGKMAYLPDHEPALGERRFPGRPAWTSGYDVAEGVDLLVHDCQYTQEEYAEHTGWGHSSLEDALAFGKLCGVGHLVAFHHDPAREDVQLARTVTRVVNEVKPSFRVTAGAEGDCYRLARENQDVAERQRESAR